MLYMRCLYPGLGVFLPRFTGYNCDVFGNRGTPQDYFPFNQTKAACLSSCHGKSYPCVLDPSSTVIILNLLGYGSLDGPRHDHSSKEDYSLDG